jgi:hypothetical protein
MKVTTDRWGIEHLILEGNTLTICYTDGIADELYLQRGRNLKLR